jgi:hypothetical protein
MNELETLRAELGELRKEVTMLRKTRWITPGAFALALVACVALGVAAPRAQGGQEPAGHAPLQMGQDLVCKSLKIVDGQGVAMLQLQSDKDGGMIVVNGADGKKRFFTAVENNAGFTDWYDPAGMRRATVFIGEAGSELRLTDKQEHPIATLQAMEAGGFAALNGPDGRNRFAAGVDNGGGYVDIFDPLGTRRATMYLNDKNSAQVKLIGADKVARFLLSGEAEGGQATSYNVEGKPVGTFPAKG